MSDSVEARMDAEPGGEPGGPERERGFTLLVALLVMALLAVLAFTLQFTAETERNISRNFYGQIQAGYAAEGIAGAFVPALLFDLQNDTVGEWANRYLVVCDIDDADGSDCETPYGFNPTDSVCYNADVTKSCVRQDTDGTLTGVRGQWLADLTYRCTPALDPADPRPCPKRSATYGTEPTFAYAPPFPQSGPIRLDRSFKLCDTADGSCPAGTPIEDQPVMPWWAKYDTDLQTGSAELAIMSVCDAACPESANCTSADPTWCPDQVLVTGIGVTEQRIVGQITRSKRPATRAVSLRLKGQVDSIWGNALVGGAGDGHGDAEDDPIIGGKYVIRGSTLMFNTDPDKWVFSFPGTDTGIVNNWYGDEDTSVPKIAGWWWQDARGCGTEFCDANNTDLGTANTNPNGINTMDSDGVATTRTIEALNHHLPNPPGGGYRPNKVEPYGLATINYSNDYGGPEGLVSEMRLKRGKISWGTGAIGREELQTTPKPGNFWDNVAALFTNEPGDMAGDPAGNLTDKLWRDLNLDTKSGDFDIDEEQLPFPNLGGADVQRYIEPVTREQYTSYYKFLRGTDTKPGGWALDLSGIDGTTGVGREVTSGDLGDALGWPRQGFPSTDQVNRTFGLGAFGAEYAGRPVLCPPSVADSVNYVPVNPDANAKRCGNSYDPVANPNYCLVHLQCQDGGGGECDGDGIGVCPENVELRIPRRIQTGAIPADPDVNLDTSSSIDAPVDRAPKTMRDSFAYKLYVDVIKAIDDGDAGLSTLYTNNLDDLPLVFKQQIPTYFKGLDPDDPLCNLNQPPGTPGYRPCFRERWAYMDVHIQLADTPSAYKARNGMDDDSGGSPDNEEEGGAPYWPSSGRWLSVRFRPSGLVGSSEPTMTVLNDPRARDLDPANEGDRNACSFNPVTDIADEVMELPVADPPGKLVADGINNCTDGPGIVCDDDGDGQFNENDYENQDPGDPIGGAPDDDTDGVADEVRGPVVMVRDEGPPKLGFWDILGQPEKYDRAKPVSPEDRLFRNMPTGAFVVALHLPCTTDMDTGDANFLNPYKCTDPDNDDPAYTPPAIAYDGFYTHTIAWAPKYSCWRTASLSWTGRIGGPPTPAPAYSGKGCPVANYRLGDAETNPEHPDFGFPNDMDIAWFAESLHQTNQTTLRNRESKTIPGGAEDTMSDLATSPEPALTGFKLIVPYNFRDYSFPGGGTEVEQPGYDRRGCLMGLDRRVQATVTGCDAVTHVFSTCGLLADGDPCNGLRCGPPTPTCPDPVPDPLSCLDEPDVVPGSAIHYGGCNEIFSPLVTAPLNPRVTGLDPEAAPFVRDEIAHFENQLPTTCETPNFRVDYLRTNAKELCAASGGDDGQVCGFRGVDPDRLGSWSPLLNRYGRGWPGWGSVNVLESAGLIMTHDKIRFGAPEKNDGTGLKPTYNALTDFRQGYYSDPIIYDGRAIIWAGPEATPASGDADRTRVFFHDFVVPRGTLGCSDFLTVLSNGDTEVRNEMQLDGRQLVALYSITQGTLKVTSPDNDIKHELAGAWIANAAALGSYATPVQLIGTPTVEETRCDHVYLPARGRLPRGEFLSFVEEPTLPSGF